MTSLRKRKRSGYAPGDYTSQEDLNQVSLAESDCTAVPYERPRKVTRSVLSHIQTTGIPFPRSAYEGFEPPLAQCSESDALLDLADARREVGAEQTNYTYCILDNFSIYKPSRQEDRHASELVSFDRIQNRNGFNELLFDGILTFQSTRRYVRGVAFSTLSIDGYGDLDTVIADGQICLQSKTNSGTNIWYKVSKPSQEYRRFYEPFVWLVTFTKLFVNYLMDEVVVTLGHFKTRFHGWLLNHYGHDPQLQLWHAECGYLRDFRTTVAANVGFLWKESYAIDDNEGTLCKAPLWGEIDPQRLRSIQAQPSKEKLTVVTPFVYELFKRMYFSAHLSSRRPSDDTMASQISKRKTRLGLTPNDARSSSMLTPMSTSSDVVQTPVRVYPGDVVTFPADRDGAWRKGQSSTWYAYVQAVRELETQTVLDVLWLYEAADTTLGKAYYPFPNELFLSDNCDCGRTAINLSCVNDKVSVSWFARDPNAVEGLFVRQKFRTTNEEDSHDFITLQHSDFSCRCTDATTDFEACRRQYFIGDTVLVMQKDLKGRDHVLDPAQVVDFDLDIKRVSLRRINRKAIYDSSALPNEVFLTENIFTVSPKKIVRKCYIRSFSALEIERGLPLPYNRKGAGDFYFVIVEHQDDCGADAGGVASLGDLYDDDCEDTNTLPPLELGPSFTDAPPLRRMNGMGIFCGGGNFDRGLEEGGAVNFKYAVDYDERAIHSYRANASDPDDVQFFYGSVDDYLARSLRGSKAEVIAPVGHVDFISAGSPCPGFSGMQPDRQSQQSLQYASLVASFVSYVDHWSPSYAILENVLPITQGMGPERSENVFAQILAALVAMGYQVQQFLMDSWSYGSPQSRTRVFIAATAPGLEPLPRPSETHDHPSNKFFMEHSLGRLSNGKTFSKRRNMCTPFAHVSAATSVADLPDVGDSQVQLCPKFPDHRVALELTAFNRQAIAAVPVRPYGMGLVQMARADRLSAPLLNWYKDRLRLQKAHEQPKAFSRMHPDGLFQTVQTAQTIACKWSGRVLHWTQDRAATVLELRRAQGFLDEEVIIGSTKQQVKIIGNSVDRNVAFALGLVLRESWSNSGDHFQSLDAVEETAAFGQLTPISEDREGSGEEIERIDVVSATDDDDDDTIAVAMRTPLRTSSKGDVSVLGRNVRRAQYVLVER